MALAALWVAGCVLLAWRYPQRLVRVADEAWTRELQDELDAAADERGKVAAVNEALSGVEHALERDRRLPAAASWLMLGGAAIVALLAWSWKTAGIIIVALVAGVMACVAARRAGRGRAERERGRVDQQVQALVGDLYDAEIVLPSRRQTRFRRRRSS